MTVAALILAASAAAAAPSPKPTLGQCRDATGRPTPCAAAAAGATDSEGVPLAAKAQVTNEVSAGVTPMVAAAAPRMVPGRCRDGAYSVGRTRVRACRGHGGLVKSWR